DPDRAAPTRESPRPGSRLSRTRISTCEFGAPRGSGDSEQLSVLGQFGIGAGGQIEAAGTAFAGLELRDRHVHPPSACISVLRRLDPADPFPAGHRRQALPHVLEITGL